MLNARTMQTKCSSTYYYKDVVVYLARCVIGALTMTGKALRYCSIVQKFAKKTESYKIESFSTELCVLVHSHIPIYEYVD